MSVGSRAERACPNFKQFFRRVTKLNGDWPKNRRSLCIYDIEIVSIHDSSKKVIIIEHSTMADGQLGIISDNNEPIPSCFFDGLDFIE